MEKVNRSRCEVHEDSRGVAVLRSRARRQLGASVRTGIVNGRCIVSSSDDSRSRTDLCLSDYVLDPEDGRRDHLAMFVVTAGEGVRSHSEEAKQRGEFLLAHALQALAIETAEGCAEWLHRRIREDWGFPDLAHDDDAGSFHVALSRQAI